MKSKNFLFGSAFGLYLTLAPAAFATAIQVNFTVLPGTDNIIGTADDQPVPLTLDATFGLETRIGSDYAFLNGGVGFTVDSLCCSGGVGLGVGTIADIGGQNVLAEARPDEGPDAYSLGSLALNLVSSADGHTKTSVASIDVRFTAGSTGVVDVFNPQGDLRAGFAVPNGSNSLNLLYSDADGISRVVFTGTGAIDLFEFDATQPLTAPPPETPAPEPGSMALEGSGLLLLGLVARRRRN